MSDNTSIYYSVAEHALHTSAMSLTPDQERVINIHDALEKAATVTLTEDQQRVLDLPGTVWIEYLRRDTITKAESMGKYPDYVNRLREEANPAEVARLAVIMNILHSTY